MSSEVASFTIEYYAGGDLRMQQVCPGSEPQAEYQALLGLIRHLYAGIDHARILDADRNEVKLLKIPRPRIFADHEFA